MKNKKKALAQFLDIKTKEIEQGYDDNIFEVWGAEYLIVTDDEADVLWEEDLDNYIEECIYPQFEEMGLNTNYFDDEAWKSDARYDGRAHSLARYDGKENSEEVKEVIYYIYRTN